jgi:transposase
MKNRAQRLRKQEPGLCFSGIIQGVKQKKYRVHYDTGKRNVQLKIDEIFAEKVVPADDSVRLLDEIMEEMDYTPLMRAYKRTGRRPATNPVTMLKLLVYAIMQGIFSSRAIALACTRDQFHLATKRRESTES